MDATNTDHLVVRSQAPLWFHSAIADSGESCFTKVEGCDVHYLYWPSKKIASADLLLVHGGGGHAYWWSFLAPMFAENMNVAAVSLSGMGDSGWREYYDSDTRVADIRGVISAVKFSNSTYVVGHSFGGFMASRLAQIYGDELGGVIIADTPIKPPHRKGSEKKRRPRMGNKRYYPSFEEGLARFRLMPSQSCENKFLVEHIGRHSLKLTSKGWCWKWDGAAMENRRFGEPFHEYLAMAKCRKAFIFGEKSALIDHETRLFIKELIGVGSPMFGIPEAHHHLMLDQPIAFVAGVRAIVESWQLEQGVQ